MMTISQRHVRTKPTDVLPHETQHSKTMSKVGQVKVSGVENLPQNKNQVHIMQLNANYVHTLSCHAHITATDQGVYHAILTSFLNVTRPTGS